MEDGGNVFSGSGRKDTHKLFVGLEWITKNEVEFQLVKIFKIGGERSEMIRIVPLPRWSLKLLKN